MRGVGSDDNGTDDVICTGTLIALRQPQVSDNVQQI